jgi:tetratricopeptide (TPR) repeat protein
MDSNRRWSVLVMVAVLSGCASMPEESAHLDRSYDPVEIADVPFFAQEQYQCGPAALATALVHSGAKTSASELVSEVYVPGRQGSLQPELLAAARAADRIPYVIDTSVSAIYAELLTGRPVLVLQNLGIKQLPRWHYAVVIGIDPGLGKVYLRSGTDRRRETDLNTFLRTWQRSNFWAFAVLQPGELPAQPDAMRYAEAVAAAFAVLQPGELPAQPDAMRYAEAVAAAQASGHEQAALASWQSAALRWPEHSVILFGLANAELSAKNFVQAESHYRRILANNPGNLMAGNNLALALAQQGKQDQALAQIDQVIAQSGVNDPLRQEFGGTRQEIRQMFVAPD